MKRSPPTTADYERLQSLLPDSPHYERSFMHRDTITALEFAKPTNFLITGSTDGHIKFWKKKDKALASAADAEAGRSTGAATNNSKDLLAKAKAASQSGKDLTFLGESIEFVKQYRAHIGSIDHLVLSYDEALAVSCCSHEQAVKIFDVLNFDMISMHKFKYIRPARLAFCYSQTLDRKILVASCQITGRLEWIDTEFLRYEIDLNDSLDKETRLVEETAEEKSARKMREEGNDFTKIGESSINCLLYHPYDRTLLTMHLDGCINFVDVDSRQISKRKLKNHPDLFNLQKEGIFPLSASITDDGKQFAVSCSDNTIRIFSYKTGKQLAKFDESIAALKEQNNKNAVMDDMEFQARSIQEKKLAKKVLEYQEKNQAIPSYYCSQVRFYYMEGGNLLVYPGMLGIRMFSMAMKRLVGTKPVGIAENLRSTLLCCAFEEFKSAKAKSLDSIMANNPNLRSQNVCDPVVFASAGDKNRFYLYSQRESMNVDRDVFNEKPTAEEMLAAQKGEEIKRIGTEAILHTSFGDIVIKLFGDECPKTVENFTVHSRNGYYNGLTFHRVVKNFMIQTGCPLGTGRGGDSIWGGQFEDEFHPSLKHDKPYMVSMANAGPNSNGSQFFVTVVPVDYLDNKHTIFGRVVKGMNVVQNISQVKVMGKQDKPIDEVKLVSVTVKLRKFN